MTPQLQHILAKKVLELVKYSFDTKESYFIMDKDEVIEKGAFNKLEQIEEIFKSGLSVLTVVEIKEEKPVFLINKLIDYNLDNVTKLVLQYLKSEELKTLPMNCQNSILDSLLQTDNSRNLEHFFEKGFRLIQGKQTINSMECDAAINGNLDFFETLMFYQPDFNLNFGYQKSYQPKGTVELETLSNIIEGELFDTQYSQKHLDRIKNLKLFIDTHILHEKLQNKIENKNTINKMKKKI